MSRRTQVYGGVEPPLPEAIDFDVSKSGVITTTLINHE